jgi:hypothetical protein
MQNMVRCTYYNSFSEKGNGKRKISLPFVAECGTLEGRKTEVKDKR